MKAAVYTRYGSPDVVEIREVPTPTPKDREVLIKVHATTVTTGDWRVRSLNVPRGFRAISRLVFGISRPRQPILGTELAGEIAAVGPAVRGFKVGDPVFAFSGSKMGCHAEYRCMPEDKVAAKPAALSYEEAATLSFGGTNALGFLRKAKIQPGDKVLVQGASGGVGSAAVQLAKHFGAEVTGVCSTANVELVRSLGADQVIDYTREDFTQRSETYDIIVDPVGVTGLGRSTRCLKRGGRLVLIVVGLPDMLRIPWTALTSRVKVIAGAASPGADALRFLAGLAESGALKPVIDRRYPFAQIVDAHRHVDTGHKRGSVVITMP